MFKYWKEKSHNEQTENITANRNFIMNKMKILILTSSVSEMGLVSLDWNYRRKGYGTGRPIYTNYIIWNAKDLNPSPSFRPFISISPEAFIKK